jgi:hypothetical protein
MSGIKISDLPAAPSSLLTDVLPADQGAVTYKETLQQVFTLFQSNGSALTKTDDTNVTLTLGGSPTTALLNAASLTLSWTGQLSLARGGTNANLTASNGAIPYSTASALALLAPGTSGQFLQSGGAGAPSWTTATFPGSAGAAGTILRSNGTNWVSSTSTFADTYGISTILYASSANTVTGLATANTSVLNTNSSGVPQYTGYSATGGTSNFVSRDSNGNTRANNFGSAATAVTSAGGTTVLTAASTRYQVLQGTLTQTFQLPDATTLFIGYRIEFNNNSTQTLTVNNASSSLICTVPAGGACVLICIATSTAGGAWDVHFYGPSNASWGTAGLAVTGTLAAGSSATQFVVNSSGVITAGSWNGSLITGTYGGTGVNNGANTATYAGNLNFASSFTTSGAFAVTQTYTGATNVTFPTSGTLATTSQIPSGAALTKADDTNVTLTLGGSPTTALVNAASITAGWTGQLGLTRGGTAASLTASNGGIVWSNASQLQILSGTATANLPLLSGSTATPSWGSFALSLGGALTTAGALTTSGAFGSTFTFTNTTAVTFPTSGTLATTSQIPTGAALTKADDTNVTLTLGGSPTTALVNAASITAGWTGQLSLARGGTAANLTASNGGIFYSTASAGAILAGTATARQMLQSGASTTPAWSTATYPATTTINQLLYSSSANTVTGLATANSSVLVTDSGGIPSLSTTLPSGISATSMSLTSPKIGGNIIDPTNGTSILLAISSAGGTPVNYVNTINSTTGNPASIIAGGSDSNIELTLASKGTKGVAVKGVTDASSAAAGYVGELISSSIVTGSAVSMSTGVAKDITSISLTAGDWDVWGNVVLTSNGTALQIAIGWISTTSATTPNASLYSGINNTSNTNAATYINCLQKPINVSSTTTVYLSGYATFASGTMTGCGNIYARRVR